MNLHPYSKQAKLSRKILTAIKKDPAKLNMGTWYNSGKQSLLRPNEKPVCGTTMCVAGWAVHFSGWNLSMNGAASKPGEPEQHSIPDLAHKLLGLPEDTDQLFFTENDIAVACLMRMASGEPFTYDMHHEEQQRAYDSRVWRPGRPGVGIEEYDAAVAQRVRQLLGLDTPAPALAE